MNKTTSLILNWFFLIILELRELCNNLSILLNKEGYKGGKICEYIKSRKVKEVLWKRT